MANRTEGKKTPVKSDDFWAGVEKLVKSIDDGTDPITQRINTAVAERDEPTVEV